MPRRRLVTLIGLTLALGAAIVVRLLAGDPAGLHLPESPEIWNERLLSTLTGAAVGAALAVAGVFLQALLRNPLAAPELLGVASGASFAVTLSFYLAYAAAIEPGAALSGSAAFVGAIATLALVYALGQRRGLIDPISLVLVGVIVALMAGAATAFIAYLMPPERVFAIARWTVGALSGETGWPDLALVAPVVLAGLALGAWLGPSMDAAAMGEDEARSVGVPIGALRLALFTGAGALTAAAVVLAGPVGFIGLVCPHIVRLLAGPSHRPLAIGAALAGATLVIAADAATRLIQLGPGRIPLGIITALVGGPVFIALLRRETLRRGP